MPFFIVETVENGDEKLLSVVPHTWVTKNMDVHGWHQLRWPITKRVDTLDKLQRDSNSIPGNNWTYQNCKKKRAGFKNFDKALAELQIMELKAETEDETYTLHVEKPRKPPTRTKNLFNTMWDTSNTLIRSTETPPLDYNALELVQEETTINQIVESPNRRQKADTEDQTYSLPVEKPKKPATRTKNLFNTMWDTSNTLIRSTETPPLDYNALELVQEETTINQIVESLHRRQSPAPFMQSTHDNQKLVEYHPQNIQQQQPLQDTLHSNIEASNTLPTDISMNFISDDQISKIFSTLNIVLDNQNNIMENQLKIIKQLSKQQATLDMMMCNTSNKEVTSASNKILLLPSPSSTVQNLEDLEIKLGNEDNLQNFINSYKHVLSNDGRSNGKTGCYKLVNQVFTRELMTQYSWSGGSRDKVVKHPFKQYERIKSAFYAIVKNVDSFFSYESCISFFQTVIRNATRRIENDHNKNKVVINRASSGRRRSQKKIKQLPEENLSTEKELHIETESPIESESSIESEKASAIGEGNSNEVCLN